MGPTTRRVLSVLLALVPLGIAAGVSSAERRWVTDAAQREVRQQAGQAAVQGVALLEAKGKEWAQRALKAASNEALLRIVQGTEGDARTFQDFVETEPGWGSFRELADTAVVAGSELLASTGSVEGLEGLQSVKEAESAGTASELLARPVPAFAAAALVPRPTPNGKNLVVLLRHPIDQADLEDVKRKLQVDVGLVFFNAPPLSTSEGLTDALANAALADQLGKAALTPEITLVALQDSGPVQARATAEADRFRVLALSGGGLLSFLVLLFGFWPRRPEDSELLKVTAEELKRSREELARLSQRLQPGTVSPLTTPMPPGGTISFPVELGRTTASATPSRYTVVGKLGEGGMATVYVAEIQGAEGFRRQFVLKRMKAEAAAQEELVHQFIDEARLGASLVHSNIVPVLDFGRDEVGYYLAQEYILGRSVDALVTASVERTGKGLPLEAVLTIGIEAAQALGYAHQRRDDSGRPLGLVHRDVSPNNLMVSMSGEVKLLDFGIVKSEGRLTRTQAGIVKGNLFYMSPEQARAHEVDARSDLFSLGLVLFTAVTGQTLYDGATSYDLINLAAAGPDASMLARIRALPGPFAAVLEQTLAFHPSHRPESAEALAAALAAAGTRMPQRALQQLLTDLVGDQLADEQARFSRREAQR